MDRHYAAGRGIHIINIAVTEHGCSSEIPGPEFWLFYTRIAENVKSFLRQRMLIRHQRQSRPPMRKKIRGKEGGFA